MRWAERLVAQVLGPATSRAVLSWPVFVVSALLSALIHLPSPEFGVGSLPFRTFASLASVLPMFAVIALVQWLPEGTVARVRIPLVLSSYLAGGGVRGWALSAMLVSAGLHDGPLQYRIPSSAIFMSVVAVLITYGWASYRNLRLSAARLHQENQSLQAAFIELEQATHAEALEQLGQVTTGIVAELRRLEMDPVSSQIRQIQRLIDGEVRPLSHALAQEVIQWTPSAVAPPVKGKRTMWRAVHPLEHLPSPWWNLVQAATLIPSAYLIFGPTAALSVPLLFGLTVIPATGVWNRLARRGLGGFERARQAVWLTGGFEVVAALGVASTYAALSGTGAPAFYVPVGLVTHPVLMWVLILGNGLWAEAVAQERRVSGAHAELQWAVARINLLAWFNRGVISRLLHGPIQNSMHAAIMRLRDAESSTIVDGVISELRGRIAVVDPAIRSALREAPDLEAGLADISRLWRGIASIEISSSPEALATLSSDAPATSIVLDLVQEACSNAIRHGHATWIHVNVTQKDAKVITLQIVNDGKPRDLVDQAGVGTRFLETCSVTRHTRLTDDRINQLEISIPTIGLPRSASAHHARN